MQKPKRKAVPLHEFTKHDRKADLDKYAKQFIVSWSTKNRKIKPYNTIYPPPKKNEYNGKGINTWSGKTLKY